MSKDYTLFYELEYNGKKYIYDPYGINPYQITMGVWREKTLSGKGGKIAPKAIQETLNTIQFQTPQLPDMFWRFANSTYQERRKLEAMSLTWLQLKIKGLKTGTNLEFVKTSRTFIPGKLYFYIYDAKHKKTLPIWDAFPLTLVLELYNDGFLGLNFHYLKLNQRIKLMIFLLRHFGGYGISRDRVMNQQKELTIKLTWNDIMGINDKDNDELIRPCIKRYLYSHIKSKIVPMESHEWAYSIFLPAHDFRKNNTHVRVQQ